MKADTHITKNWSLVSLLTFFSRIAGYIRDVVIAYFFGASYQTDAFYVAYRIPNLLRRLFAEGSLTVAFIPIFTDYLKEGRKDAKEALNSIFTVLFIILIAVCFVGVIFSPYVIKIFAAGFDKESFNLAVDLNRIMFPYIFFISLAALAMGILNSLRHFFIPAFSPIVLNVTIVASIFLFFNYFENPTFAIAIGVIVGGFFQLLINIPFLKAKDFLFSFTKKLKHPSVIKLSLLIAPQLFGLAIYNINILVNTQFASFMPRGTVSYLFFSERLIEFPLGVFAVSIATVMLPELSSHVSNKNFLEFKKSFSHSIKLMFYIIVPALFGLIALRVPLCNFLFQRGEFTHEAVIYTSQALMGYSVGLWSVGGLRLTVPAFYALKDTKTPVLIAFFALIINVLFGYTLGFKLGLNHLGLALASSLSSVFNFLVLLYLLDKRVDRIFDLSDIKFVLKVLASSIIVSLLAWKISTYADWSTSEITLNKVSTFFISILIPVLIYFVLSKLFKISEAQNIVSVFKRK